MNLIISLSRPENRSVLEEYGFNKPFVTDKFSLYCNLEILREKAKELNFLFPETIPLLLFHNLGQSELDSAYLYDARGNPVAVNVLPNLEQINGLSKKLTQLYPPTILVSYYTSDRFAIPILTTWQNGKVTSKSSNAGSEIYRQDYWKDDEIEFERRGRKLTRGLKEVMNNPHLIY